MAQNKKIFFCFLCVCVAFIIGAVMAFIIWRAHLAHEVNAKLAAIRAAGLPTNGLEANNYYSAVPDDENAALKMEAAFTLMTNYNDRRSNEVSSIKFPSRTNTFTSQQLELISGYCLMNSNALAQAAEAVQLLRCRYPIDLSRGAATLLPHLAKLRRLSLVAGYSSLLDTNESSADISTIIGMSRTLDSEPLIISKLVRIALLNIAVTTLERRLNAGEMDEAQLNHLSQSFAGVVQTNQMANGLIGERAMYIPYFRMSWAEINKLSQDDGADDGTLSGPPLPGAQPMLFRVTGFFDRDLNYYLQVMQTNIAFAERQPPQSLMVTNFEHKMYDDLRRKYCILSALLLPALGNAIIKEANSSAHIRIAETAIAIERFRLTRGKLPKKLDELVPQFLSAVPMDPFDGQLLRYRRLEKGYVIYSVDRDGEDNGGRERPPTVKSTDKTHYDITFTVER